MQSFEKRTESFNKELVTLQKKYKVGIYAANTVINKNMEVSPLVRITDMAKKTDDMVLAPK